MVTGGSGFIGRNLVEHFRDSGMEVELPGHKDLDLTDPEAVRHYVREHRIDVVVHTANMGGNRKQVCPDVIGTNLRMFLSIYRCRDEVDQVLHLGSGAEYDRRNYHPRLREEDFGTHVPIDDYGFSKLCMSELATNTKNITVFRLFGVFGTYEDHEFRFISNAIVKNLFGLPITVQQNVNFDYIWAKDVARVLHGAMITRMRHRHYNLCTGTTIDLVSLANLINDVSGRPVPINVVNSGMNVEYSGDNSRLMKELGVFEFTRVERAIATLFEHYREMLPRIDRDIIAADRYASKCQVIK
jgi:nucleoside-diphosphate-sugar epimerase